MTPIPDERLEALASAIERGVRNCEGLQFVAIDDWRDEANALRELQQRRAISPTTRVDEVEVTAEGGAFRNMRSVLGIGKADGASRKEALRELLEVAGDSRYSNDYAGTVLRSHADMLREMVGEG
jgi:hypothetical protein